jgi:hypothetical protein
MGRENEDLKVRREILWDISSFNLLPNVLSHKKLHFRFDLLSFYSYFSSARVLLLSR